MTPEESRNLLIKIIKKHDLTYNQMGVLLNCYPTSIGYWVRGLAKMSKKHNETLVLLASAKKGDDLEMHLIAHRIKEKIVNQTLSLPKFLLLLANLLNKEEAP